MSPHRVPQLAQVVCCLVLLLAALLTGAALGHLLLPPGHLGRGLEVGLPGPSVPAVAAARSFPPARPGEPITEPGQTGVDLVRGAAVPRMPGRGTGHPAWGPGRGPHGSSRTGTRDWRLEMQVGPTWQYAAGAESRNLRAPDSAPSGTPR
jgi:hypothetical protein